MSLLFESISKSFAGIRALQDVSLEVRDGAVLGLVGENGAGKTTLMNVLGGVVEPDSGTMSIAGEEYKPTSPADAIRSRVAFIHQELNLFTNLSIAENIFIDRFPKVFSMFLDTRALNERARPVLRELNLDLSPSVTVETLSPGERQMVEIAKALAAEASIIIFDEPTTSLTDNETNRLFSIIRQLRDSGRTVIYISHILEDVLELADDVAVLRDGRLVGAGSVEDFSTDRMISLMVGRDITNLYPEKTAVPTGEPVLVANRVSQPGIVRDISFSLRRGEILGLFGLMGSGRTELARILFGIDPFESGTIESGDQVFQSLGPQARIDAGLAFVTEDRREEGLLMESPISENLALVSLSRYTQTPAALVNDRKLVAAGESMKEQLRIRTGDIQLLPAKSLSGGNQQKVVLGKWLLTDPSILILDEPTRGIDVGAKYEVYSIVDKLAAEGAGVLMISSELGELIGMSDRILVMSRGEVTGEFARDEFEKEAILRAAFRQSEIIADAGSAETGANKEADR